jgi:hypothetical protein
MLTVPERSLVFAFGLFCDSFSCLCWTMFSPVEQGMHGTALEQVDGNGHGIVQFGSDHH